MRRPRPEWIAIGVVAILFSVWASYFVYRSSFVASDGERYFCLFDDSMISMRYAWNLSHGNGLVWNEGERVEGFTNLLMTLYMAIPTGLLDKSAAALAVQISGLAFLLAVGILAVGIGRRLLEGTPLAGRGLLSVLFFACGLAYYPLCFWSLMGMETGLLSALLLGAVYAALRVDGRRRFVAALPILCGLAFLTRPDAAVPVALVALFRLSGLVGGKGWLRVAALEAGALAAFVAAAFAFRLAYYGSWMPNTYVLKMTGMPLGTRIENGLGFVERFWGTAAVPVGISAVGLALRPGRRAALLFSLFLAAVGYQIWVGGDAWVYWRMLAPLVPILMVLCAAEVALLVNAGARGGGLERLSRRRWVPPMAWLEGAIAAAALVPIALAMNEQFEKEYTFEALPYTVNSNRANVNVSLALLDLTDPEATVGVTWAGAIPYYTGRRAIDFLGKSDPYIASLAPDLEGGVAWRGMKSVPGHNKYDLTYSIVERRPTFVQARKWGRQNLSKYVDEHYERVRHRGVTLALRKGSPHVRWDRVGKGGDRRRGGRDGRGR